MTQITQRTERIDETIHRSGFVNETTQRDESISDQSIVKEKITKKVYNFLVKEEYPKNLTERIYLITQGLEQKFASSVKNDRVLKFNADSYDFQLESYQGSLVPIEQTKSDEKKIGIRMAIEIKTTEKNHQRMIDIIRNNGYDLIGLINDASTVKSLDSLVNTPVSKKDKINNRRTNILATVATLMAAASIAYTSLQQSSSRKEIEFTGVENAVYSFTTKSDDYSVVEGMQQNLKYYLDHNHSNVNYSLTIPNWNDFGDKKGKVQGIISGKISDIKDIENFMQKDTLIKLQKGILTPIHKEKTVIFQRNTK